MSSDTSRSVFETFGHVAPNDAYRQAFDDRGFPHARIADEHGIVFRAARQNLDDAPNLFIPADDGIELALLRPCR